MFLFIEIFLLIKIKVEERFYLIGNPKEFPIK